MENHENNAVETETKKDDLHGETLGDRAKVLSPTATVMKRFFRSKLSVVGLAVIIFLFLFSFLGPLFSPWYDGASGLLISDTVSTEAATSSTRFEYEINGETYFAYEINEYEKNFDLDPTWAHLLGTDKSSKDILTQLMVGGQVSLTIGFLVIIVETLIGMALGGLAGYFGGWVDQVIMRIVDILYCIPQIPIMLIVSAVLDGLDVTGYARLYIMMGFLTLIGWAGTARLVRGQILTLREQEFMLAAKASGLSVGRKIFKHLIPNVMPQLIVTMTLGLGQIILMEATLGYLGLGAPIGSPTWGTMLNSAVDSISTNDYFNYWVPAGVCITAAILAFNFVGDGLRDAFDPKMKR
ncbi:MAG: ABC transporter permease [Clostridia bacterium]|nr:ABC transporter permease [Clostridia bacterium]